MLTPAQKVTLKANILATPEALALEGNLTGLSDYYNALVTPAFIVWKTRVSINEIGDNIVGTELAGLSTLNATRLQTVVALSADGVNPGLADRRAFFDDIFSGAGGVLTRAKLAILWKRSATRLEKLFSTGTGTTAAPATTAIQVTLTIDGLLSVNDLIGL